MSEDHSLSLNNTLDKGLFDGGASKNIDGGEDVPQIGDVKVPAPKYKLGGYDINVPSRNNLNNSK
jgi:hypothetical protein